MTTWFTSDLHFGHRNIIEYCNRPWATVEEMDAGLIENWNSRVKPMDIVYVLGDFSLHHKAARLDEKLEKLNGFKHLVRGNHDNRRSSKNAKGWLSVNEMIDTEVDGFKIRMMHYKLEDWRGTRILLHGHSHSKDPITGIYSYDVGVDGNNYAPITLSEILTKFGRGVTT